MNESVFCCLFILTLATDWIKKIRMRKYSIFIVSFLFNQPNYLYPFLKWAGLKLGGEPELGRTNRQLIFTGTGIL